MMWAAATMSAIESQAPTSWNATASTAWPWTRASASREVGEDVDGTSADRRQQAAFGEAHLQRRPMHMRMIVSGENSLHLESAAIQNAVGERNMRETHRFLEPRRIGRRDRASGEFRVRIEQRADEHVAGNAADGIEVDVDVHVLVGAGHPVSRIRRKRHATIRLARRLNENGP